MCREAVQTPCKWCIFSQIATLKVSCWDRRRSNHTPVYVLRVTHVCHSFNDQCSSIRPGFHSNAIACVGKQPIMVTTASTEHFYWLALAFVAWKFHATKQLRQPTGMLGRSSGSHDWLLANASACVSCGFRLRNARNARDCVWMETGLHVSRAVAVNKLRWIKLEIYYGMLLHVWIHRDLWLCSQQPWPVTAEYILDLDQYTLTLRPGCGYALLVVVLEIRHFRSCFT